MTNLFASLMRTLVPIGVGLVLGLAARVGLDLDDGMVTTYVTAGLTAAYYAGFRALEELAGRIGWEPLRTVSGVLLGWARPPLYVQPATVPIRVRLRFDADEFAEQVAAIAERGGGTVR